MKRKSLLFAVIILVLAFTVACGGKTPPATEAPVEAPAAAEPAPVVEAPTEEAAVEEVPAVTEVTTDFPLPEDASGLADLGNGAINFQTTLSIPDAVTFYRSALIDLGYTEREILTVVEDATFSIVFDGHESGKAIVVQGVNLGESVNINIRLEDV